MLYSSTAFPRTSATLLLHDSSQAPSLQQLWKDAKTWGARKPELKPAEEHAANTLGNLIGGRIYSLLSLVRGGFLAKSITDATHAGNLDTYTHNPVFWLLGVLPVVITTALTGSRDIEAFQSFQRWQQAKQRPATL